ncbi:carbohydrate ABC transporter permease [Tessaracoccus flavus]|uniref:Sugar ABC transporter permease n=1 Tax=Tessaracoccus flavus TaxID=1610493 RepID=A0A1Q2CC70_9ACTN|nr:sugar ABC transporter permease [Tessaracoccus flavus]AQP43713.1 sugar ABC transporter permease [Tessaracoccus flavus]SDZ03384.1 alpha-glucoside transport system permease protein [Tessaracoccus flavus]
MSTPSATPPPVSGVPDSPDPSGPPTAATTGLQPLKVIGGAVGAAFTLWFMGNLFLAFAYYPQWFFDSKILMAILALIVGVGGAAIFFWFLNMAIEGLPRSLEHGLMPYAFLLPGFSLIGLMLLYPTIQTINYSFANRNSTEYMDPPWANYTFLFQSSEFWSAIFNNVLWIAIVPAVTVALGVIVAVLSDKLSAAGEKWSKSFIFLPMAISFVAASAIWSTTVYGYQPPGQPQTAILNAMRTATGNEPLAWLSIDTGRLNSLLLMVILIWLQVGFAMVLLSSAIKGVPEDTIEAARIDGASEFKIFFQVIIPQIMGTIITVFITVLILVMKVFDIIYVLTNGRNNTDVIANMFFREMFTNLQAGRATAIVVVLLVAILPVLIYQVRLFRQQESMR